MENMIQIYNYSTDELIIRERTAEELTQRNNEQQAYLAEKQARQSEAENLWRTKVSAYEKLGLTTTEIEAIAPTPVWLLPKA